MSTKDNRIVQPYLFFNGSCEQAIEFYRKALGAEVEMMMRFKESPERPPPGAVPPGSENKIMHASFRIGQTTVLASDGDSSDKASFQGFSLSLAVPSEAEADRVFNALAEGGAGKATTHKDVLFSTLWHGGRPVWGGLDDHGRVARTEMSPGIQDRIKRHGEQTEIQHHDIARRLRRRAEPKRGKSAWRRRDSIFTTGPFPPKPFARCTAT